MARGVTGVPPARSTSRARPQEHRGPHDQRAARSPRGARGHANVDRLWAQWQGTHPGSLPAPEGTFELEPFNRPYTNQWQRGADVESTSALDYQYRRFCFVFPPIRIWETVAIDWPLPLRRQMASARVLVKTGAMQTAPVEIRAFVGQPGATARTKTAGNPAFAGSVGFLGHGARVPAPKAPVESAEESGFCSRAPAWWAPRAAPARSSRRTTRERGA